MSDDDLRFGDLESGDGQRGSGGPPADRLGQVIDVAIRLIILAVILYAGYHIVMTLLTTL